MEFKYIEDYKFIKFNYDNVYMFFSTAEGDLDFNKSFPKGIENLNNLKRWFNVDYVSYLNQTHSNKVLIADENVYDGDALITNESNRIIGVFTADCVPILLVDKQNKAIAAVHSGWKGTVQDIVLNTIEELKNKYNSKEENINVYIGPHNKKCCYEVGEDVIALFRKKKCFNENMYVNRKINLEAYIVETLINKGIKRENIYTENLCTYCDKEVKLHSYRKAKNGYGRMFSFIFIK